MRPEQPKSELKALEKVTEWFVWLLVIGGTLLGIGMLLMHEFGPHS